MYHACRIFYIALCSIVFFFAPLLVRAEIADYAGQCTSNITGSSMEFGEQYFRIKNLPIKSTSGELIQPFTSCKDITPQKLYGTCLCGLIGAGAVSSLTDLIPGVPIFTDPSGLKYAFKTLTPAQTDCAVFSDTFQKIAPAGTYLAKGCTWKIPEGYKLDEAGDVTKQIKWQPVAPELAINIPGFKGFSQLAPEQESGGRAVYVSYLAEYLAALYRFLISIVGIISAVLVMVGGFQWIIAGGNSAQRSSARERVEGALVGLVLAVGSYLVLYIINPDLVKFKSLRIPIIENVELEDAEFPARGGFVGTPKALSNTIYDAMFQKFAGCIGMDWRVYKVLAHHESGLNPTAKSPKSSATGLFQVLKGYCPKILKKVSWDMYCENPGLTNPAVNTAIVTHGHFKMALNTINGLCGSAGANEKLHMLLFNNGSGPGALKKAIKNYGCDTKKWETHPDIFHAASYANGVKTVKTMRSLGVENLTGPKNDAQCPFTSGATPTDFPL